MNVVGTTPVISARHSSPTMMIFSPSTVVCIMFQLILLMHSEIVKTGVEGSTTGNEFMQKMIDAQDSAVEAAAEASGARSAIDQQQVLNDRIAGAKQLDAFVSSSHNECLSLAVNKTAAENVCTVGPVLTYAHGSTPCVVQQWINPSGGTNITTYIPKGLARTDAVMAHVGVVCQNPFNKVCYEVDYTDNDCYAISISTAGNLYTVLASAKGSRASAGVDNIVSKANNMYVDDIEEHACDPNEVANGTAQVTLCDGISDQTDDNVDPTSNSTSIIGKSTSIIQKGIRAVTSKRHIVSVRGASRRTSSTGNSVGKRTTAGTTNPDDVETADTVPPAGMAPAPADADTVLLAQSAKLLEPCIQLCISSCIASAVDQKSCGGIGILLGTDDGSAAVDTASCLPGFPLQPGRTICQNAYTKRCYNKILPPQCYPICFSDCAALEGV